MRTLRVLVITLSALVLSVPLVAQTASTQTAAPASTEKPFIVEYYYKAMWGHADEFITLFKKNHLPVLRKQIEMGRLLQVTATTPRYHGTEDGRWDYRITITFRNAAVANADFDEATLQRQLFPDQQTFKHEEQRRFEILDAHWDLPIKPLDLDAR